MRRLPGEGERDYFALRDTEAGDGFEVFAAHLHRCSQLQGVGAGHCAQAIVAAADPRDDASVIEAEDRLQLHRHGSAPALDDADEVDAAFALADRHEVDERDTFAAG
jgi:hypothetical protein